VGEFVLSSLEFKPIVIIPVYNHQHAIRQTLQDVLVHNYPVLLVNDGSDRECSNVLIGLEKRYSPRVTLLRLDENKGKGAAVKAGFRLSFEKGYTHALQVDADGQHNLADLPHFMKIGQDNRDAVIAGYPEYDESVPKGRYYSRYLTHIWVWINTLSFEIKDSMCGFRLYPLAEIITLLNQEPCGDRMDFDTEIIVRWVWRGGKIENILTKVRYPIDGISHFDVFHDNVRISWMHTRLFFGMLKRLPRIIWRRA